MKKKEIEYRRKLLINFLTLYVNKKFHMSDLMNNLRTDLQMGKKITISQFNAIVKFLERERAFKGKRREFILEYFSPLLRNYRKENNNESTDEPSTLSIFQID